MDRAGPRPRLGRSAGRGRLRPHQPASPLQRPPRLRPGLGGLSARKEAVAKLHKPWFAGGTITVASVQGDKYYLAEGPAAFEDGTPDYLNIPAVQIGLQHIESIGIEAIRERVRCLTGHLLDE